ncbi:MAG: hypothetical protein AABZ30_02385 [Myxococcota bacterium]
MCHPVVAVVLAGLTIACGNAPPSGRITGEVRYGGRLQGVLLLAVYDHFPPAGTPLATVAIENPRFPQAFALETRPGPVYVLAALDTSPDDGLRYHSRVDAGAAWPALRTPEPLRLGPAQTLRVDLDLEDPRPGLPSP